MASFVHKIKLFLTAIQDYTMIWLLKSKSSINFFPDICIWVLCDVAWVYRVQTCIVGGTW